MAIMGRRLLAASLLLASSATGCSGNGEVGEGPSASSWAEPSPIPPLAAAVQITRLAADGEPCRSKSGVAIDGAGTSLTDLNVADLLSASGPCADGRFVIEAFTALDGTPVGVYEAEFVALSDINGLAAFRPKGVVDGIPVELAFQAVELSASNPVEGQSIRVPWASEEHRGLTETTGQAVWSNISSREELWFNSETGAPSGAPVLDDTGALAGIVIVPESTPAYESLMNCGVDRTGEPDPGCPAVDTGGLERVLEVEQFSYFVQVLTE